MLATISHGKGTLQSWNTGLQVLGIVIREFLGSAKCPTSLLHSLKSTVCPYHLNLTKPDMQQALHAMCMKSRYLATLKKPKCQYPHTESQTILASFVWVNLDSEIGFAHHFCLAIMQAFFPQRLQTSYGNPIFASSKYAHSYSRLLICESIKKKKVSQKEKKTIFSFQNLI